MLTMLHFLLSLYFAAMVGVAGATKLSDPKYFKATLLLQGVLPARVTTNFALLFPCGEIVLSLLLG